MSIARNQPCVCGSGKKYKHCCGRLGEGGAANAALGPDALEQLLHLAERGEFVELETRTHELLPHATQPAVLWQLLAIARQRQGKEAVGALEEARRLLPDDAVVQLNLANEYARAGSTAQAEAGYRRALTLSPQFAEAHANFAALKLACNDAHEAAAMAQRAIEAKPDYAAAHFTQGNALLRLGRFEEAQASLRRAIDLSPALAEAHLGLALVRRALGRLDEAETGLLRALAVAPDYAAAHIELASTYRLQGRAEDCEASCRAALRLLPDSPAAQAVLAELAADRGEFEQSVARHRQVLARDPKWVDSWAALARLKRFREPDADWEEAVTRLAEDALPPGQESVLRYALGKYFDDLGKYEQAFAEFERANLLAKQSAPAHDRSLLSNSVDALIRSFDGAWLKSMRAAGNEGEAPVFIVGMLRSGTSLAEQMLASHPAVHGAGELSFWAQACAARIEQAARQQQRAVFAPSELKDLGAKYLSRLMKGAGGRQVGIDKMPTNFFFLGLLKAALPGARIIQMLRDPKDTCLSIYFQRFEAGNAYTNDLEDLAHYVREYERLMAHWRKVLPQENLLSVPYEELVLNPEAWVRRMLDFLGLPFDAQCLEFHKNPRAVLTASRWQVRQSLYADSVGRWRHYQNRLAALLELPAKAR